MKFLIMLYEVNLRKKNSNILFIYSKNKLAFVPFTFTEYFHLYLFDAFCAKSLKFAPGNRFCNVYIEQYGKDVFRYLLGRS
jgi:hypothetical protein